MNILYFASFSERLQTESEHISASNNMTGKQLLELLQQRGEPWSTVLSDSRLLFAVNQELCSLDTPLSDNDEVAFLPPVTGG